MTREHRTATYGTGYSFNSQTGFSLTGTIRTRQPGEYPVVNSYVLFHFSYGPWTLYKILSETGVHEGITYNRCDSKGSNLTPSRGTFIDEVAAEDGTYPDDGCIWGVFDYWYVKDRLVLPELHMKIGGSLKAWQKGWVKIDGQLREIESIHIKVAGALKEI